MRWVKDREGGIVLEAALVLPLFFSLLLLLVSFIRLSLCEMALQSTVSETAKVIASNMYPVELLYNEAKQQWAASAPGVWLDQVVTQANGARQQVVDAESFTDNYSRFIPEPIVRLMAWEKSYREQLEAKGGESTQELKTSIRRHAAEAATPIIASFAETGILQPEKLKVTDLQLPDFNAGTSAYVTVEAQYSYTFLLPFFKKTVVLRKKATERAWIGG